MSGHGRLSDWLQPRLDGFPAEVGAIGTTRRGPDGDDYDVPLASATDGPRRHAELSTLADLPGLPCLPRQVHGALCLRVDGSRAASEIAGIDADALYCDVPGTVIGVRHADCLPLLIARRDGREVAAVHAGWRGLAAGVIESAVREFRGAPAELAVWLGPAIGPDSFEVGDEVRAAFVAHDSDAALAFRSHRAGTWWCDLYRLARQRLAALGVTAIVGGGACTLRDAARFHSFRRDRTALRMASLIWRKQ